MAKWEEKDKPIRTKESRKPFYIVVEDYTPEYDSAEDLERFDSLWSTRPKANKRAGEISKEPQMEGRVIETFMDVSGE